MRLSSYLMLVAVSVLSLERAAAQDSPTPVGTFVSSNIRTYYSSKCSTASGTVSVASVPTSTTSTARMPNVAISSTNTITPSTTFTSTLTKFVGSTVTNLAVSPLTAIHARRELPLTAAVGKRQQTSTSTSVPDNSLMDSWIAMNNAPPPSPPQKREEYIPGHLGRRAMYPTQINCAVTTMVMTTSMFTATAAARTIATVSTTTTAAPTSTVSVNGPFNLKIGGRRTSYGDGLGTYFGISSGSYKYLAGAGIGTNKAAAPPFYFDPAAGHILSPTGLVLGKIPTTAGDPFIQFYSADQAIANNIALVSVALTPITSTTSYEVLLQGQYTWWWTCSPNSYLAMEDYQRSCPTWNIYAEPV